MPWKDQVKSLEVFLESAFWCKSRLEQLLKAYSFILILIINFTLLNWTCWSMFLSPPDWIIVKKCSIYVSQKLPWVEGNNCLSWPKSTMEDISAHQKQSSPNLSDKHTKTKKWLKTKNRIALKKFNSLRNDSDQFNAYPLVPTSASQVHQQEGCILTQQEDGGLAGLSVQ